MRHFLLLFVVAGIARAEHDMPTTTPKTDAKPAVKLTQMDGDKLVFERDDTDPKNKKRRVLIKAEVGSSTHGSLEFFLTANRGKHYEAAFITDANAFKLQSALMLISADS